MSDNLSEDIPNASASSFCCKTFNLVKSLKEPACAANSLANPSWSPASDKALALSKLSCLPVINSAFNSFSILLSKLSNDLELATISSNSAPNNLAAVTALAIASGLAPKLALTWPVTLPVASNISLLFNATPADCCKP